MVEKYSLNETTDESGFYNIDQKFVWDFHLVDLHLKSWIRGQKENLFQFTPHFLFLPGAL